MLVNSKALVQAVESLGCRAVISCVPELELEDRAKIRLELLSDFPSSLPPDTVYIIKTSGSTGQAKTVFVTNSSIVPNIRSISEEWKLTSSDCVLMSSPPTFDPHIIDVFVSFSEGKV